jgi:DNA repair exonuclease SbcCD ATPase subunit
VIEFALLFGLGFLSALLIAMLVAPAVHRRIVVFTENRIRATVPISPQEVRAQRDMARAVYAAENARTKQELVQEKDKVVSLILQGDNLKDEIRRLSADNIELKAVAENLDVAAADLKSQLRQEESHIAELKAALEASEEESIGKDQDVERLKQQMELLVSKRDNTRIDLSTRETEVENLKFRVSALREERDNLRKDVRIQTARAKEAETRLANAEYRSTKLEDKLTKEVSLRTDKETALERRNEELTRLREKMPPQNGSQPNSALKQDVGAAAKPSMKAPVSKPDEDADNEARIAQLAGDSRNRATALSERVANGKTTANDDALREEMATIAANMVAMTSLSEGKSSPINAMIAGKPANGKRQSLASRARTLLEQTNGPTSDQ